MAIASAKELLLVLSDKDTDDAEEGEGELLLV